MPEYVLQLRGIYAGYGQQTVLRGLNLEIIAGEWFCLLGPNGAGKSTLLQCISTEVQPTAGELTVCGRSMLEETLDAKQLLGVAARPEQLPDLLTGQECMEVYAHAKGLQSIEPDVTALASALGFAPFMNRCVDTYSLGTRQKLCVLLALLGRPRLIVLDEAFNGLDPASSLTLKRYLRTCIQDSGCAVLLATHSLDIVEHYADRAALLIEGAIVRTWQAADLEALRGLGGNALEESMSAVGTPSDLAPGAQNIG
jgi:ABC-type multidrug transport system ATPase subunit